MAMSAASLVHAAPRVTASPMRPRVDYFIFDERFPAAVQTALHVNRAGVPVHAVSGDMTQLWYDQLDMQWRKAPAVFAGVTTQTGLFVLSTLAADHGMRVAYRGEHQCATDGSEHHSIRGPAAHVAAATPLRRQSYWGAAAASALSQCPAVAAPPVTADFHSRALQSSLSRTLLCSWIIAPRAAVSVSV
jgi:hypothetical protein